MTISRLAGAAALVASLGLLAACQRQTPAYTPQPGASAAMPVVPGTARIMGGSSNADIQRVQQGSGAQAPIVPGTGRIMGGISNAEVQRAGGGAPPPGGPAPR